MTSAVDDLAPPRDDDAEPLSCASSGWLATVASGLAVIAAASIAAAVLLIVRDDVRDLLRATVLSDLADADVGVTLLHDGAMLAMLLGLWLITRGDRSTRDVNPLALGPMLAGIALFAVCLGEHAFIAWRSVRGRGFALSPAGDPLWQAIAVDARYLAWALAISATLARVGRWLRRDGRTTLVARVRFLAVAWPISAATVVLAARLGDVFGAGATLANGAWTAAVTLGLGVGLASLLLVGVVEWRLIAASRVARRREGLAVAHPPIDDSCIRCGYDLRGIANEAACPECGLLAGRSRTPASSHLRDAPPPWLRGIALGIRMILFAVFLGGLWPFVFVELVLPKVLWTSGASGMTPGVRPSTTPELFGFDVDLSLVLHVPLLALAATLFAGVWLLVRPQRSDRSNAVLPTLLRAFAAIPFVAFAILYWNTRADALSGGASPAMVLAAIALLPVGCAPIPALAFALLRQQARRVLNANLAEHATIVGVGLSLTLAAIPPFAIAQRLSDASKGGTSNTSTYLLLTIAVASVLFGGWAIVNGIRFARAFARAEREATRLWRDADLTADDRVPSAW